MNIFLVGYMGSGKSTIAKTLAQSLKYNFIDLDAYIESKAGCTISELFASKGEIYFRKLETQCLKALIKTADNSVIALGGGTPCYGANMQLLLEAHNSKSFYLKASVSSLTERLFLEKEHRPLLSHLSSKAALNEFIGKHLFERSAYYNQCDVTITTDNKQVDDVVKAIKLSLV